MSLIRFNTQRLISPFELFDLTLLLIQQWARPIYHAWFSLVLPIFLLLAFLGWQHLSLAIFLVWWLKPIYSQSVLYALTQQNLAQKVTFWGVWKHLWRLCKTANFWLSLTIFRLSTRRSLMLSIRSFNVGSMVYSQRSLTKKYYLIHGWLNFVVSCLQVFFVLTVIFLPFMLFPHGELKRLINIVYNAESLIGWLILLFVWFIAESLFEPYYVAAGFVMYLHRKQQLECYDIEDDFKRIGTRKNTANFRVGSHFFQMFIFCCMLFSGIAFLASSPVFAQANAKKHSATNEEVSKKPGLPDVNFFTAAKTPAFSSPEQEKKIQSQLDNVFQEPDFGRDVTDHRWEKKSVKSIDEQKIVIHDDHIFRETSQVASNTTRYLVYAGLAIGALVFVIFLLRYALRKYQPNTQNDALPSELFGLDVRRESLPDDIGGSALAALKDQNIILALSLLYRASLVALIHDYQINFLPGDTEQNCLKRVSKQLAKADEDYFVRLVNAWLVTVYGHQPPDESILESLCVEWQAHFNKKSESSTTHELFEGEPVS